MRSIAEPHPLTPGQKRARFTALPYLLPRLEDVLFIALFLGVFGLGPRLLNMDGDLGRHLTIGELILSQRAIPTTDLFSHTMAGEPLTPHEWLAQAVFALAFRLGGLDGVVFLCAFLIAFTFTLVFRQCAARSGLILLSTGIAILAAAAASLHWLARPHLFTLLMVVIWTGELERVRQGNNPRVWLFPVLMLSWANLHGAFLAGFVLLVVYMGGEILEMAGDKGIRGKGKGALRRLAAAGILSFLASLANPAGPGLWETSLGFLSNRYLVGHTVEYLPPNFQDPSAWPFLILIMLSILIPGLAGASLKPAHALQLAAWTAMGLISARNIPLYAVLAAPILAEATGALLRAGAAPARWVQIEKRLADMASALRGHSWPAVVVCLAILSLAGGMNLNIGSEENRFDPGIFPVAAVDFLEGHPPPGDGFNYFPWGGYLLFRLWPEQRVYIDGQTDFYGESLTRRYEQVITLQPGWREELRQSGVGWGLMPPDSALSEALRAEPGWREVYRDGTAVIFFSNR